MFERYRHHPPPSSEIREGMTVFTGDGHRLGQVIEVDERTFAVERSAMFPKGWRARREEVKELKGKEIYLRRGRDALLRELDMERRHETYAPPSSASVSSTAPAWSSGEPERAADRLRARELAGRLETRDEREAPRAVLPGTREPAAREHEEGEARRELLGRDLGREEMRIPVADEELEVVKRENPRVAARVHKRVVTEIRELRVPIRREELVIERVPYRAGEGREVSDAEFKEDHFVIPLVEEEIEIRKHPRVREEVVIRKTSNTEERRLSEPVRREVVEVERQTDLSRAYGGHPPPDASDPTRH